MYKSSIICQKLRQISLLLLLVYLAGCATQPHETQTTSVSNTLNLAIWDFDNNSMSGGDIDYLSKALSEILLNQLSQTSSIHLVERINLRQALEEQHLSTSQLASEESRLKLGQIVGANHMMFGSYMAMGKQVRVDVRVVDVETSLVKFSEEAISTPADIATHMQTIAQHIAEKLANDSLTNKLTTNMALWQRYEQGISLMDQHKYDQALIVFSDILKTNPEFKAAEKQISVLLELQTRQ